MTPFYETQDFYKKMLELQEKLRKSEDERMKLEERFNLLSQDSRNRREACINKLRIRYIDFLEEQRLRDERNHQILGALDKIDGSLARMTARTDRLGILRKQYEAYLLRLYANRSVSGRTGDSGVGSHNDDKSPKVTVLQTEKERPSMQRIVTQSEGNLPNFIPQTNYPQSHIGASNISDFHIVRHAPGQDIASQGHVIRTAHGQGDGPATTIVHPHRIPQMLHGSQSNFENTSGSKKTQSTAEFLHSSENYPPQFSLSSDNPFAQRSAQIQRHGFSDMTDQCMADPKSRYTVDQSTTRLENPFNNYQRNLGAANPDSRLTIGLESNKINAKNLPDFSTDFANQTLGPYRHSTPLPGYLDYSTRYSRDPSGHETNVPRRSGLTTTDLEKVIHRNEQILPKDYLHNRDTLKPLANTSKLSSVVGDQRRVSDAKPSRDTHSDGLDDYINRIRSLHRDNDQSAIEPLDVEENTSGDLLNATLSDDGIEPPPYPLPSDSKTQNDETKTLPEDIRNVLELADNFLAETAVDLPEDRDIRPRSVFRGPISEKDVEGNAKLKLIKPDDVSPVTLASDMTLDNLSISATRDDILSGTTSLDLNQSQDTSAIPSDKFKPEVTLPIADLDTQRSDINDVTKASENNTVGPSELPRNECDQNRVPGPSPVRYLEMTEKISDPETRGTVVDTVNPIKIPPTQSTREEPDFVARKTEVHEDIEGDEVSLVKEEQPIEKVIDVIRELQPASLQHYEKNVVEICLADGDINEDIKSRKGIPEDENSELKVEKTVNSALDESNAAELVPSQNLDANEITAELDAPDRGYSSVEKTEGISANGSQKDANKYLQCSGDTEAKYKEDSDQRYPNDGHRPDQQPLQNSEENRGTDQGYNKISKQSYNPETNEPPDYDMRQTGDESDSFQQPYTAESNEPYDSNQIYDTDQRYEINPDQQYAHDANRHTEGQYEAGSNEQYMGDSDKQFAADPNEQYFVEPNEQYATHVDDQYAVDPNNQYAVGADEQYTVDPNEQYSYYQNDPNAAYENSGNEKYEYSGDQNYEQDPNQRYEQDPNQQYEHDPYQQYEHDPNEPYPQDANEGYKDPEYEQNQSYEPVDYREAEPAGNEQLKDESNFESSNENHQTAVAEEENEFSTAPSDLHVQELSNPGETKAAEDSGESERKKDKDVIKALLESDTESTIERNPSNNTESDFDFN